MSDSLSADVEPISAADLALVEPEWRSLEARAGELSPYVGYDWLSGWARIYEPGRMLLCRVRDADGETLALGLIEAGRGGRWRFGGGPASARRGLLCAEEADEQAWGAFAAWLGSHGRSWRTLDAAAVPYALPELPHVQRTGVPVFRFALPASFDDYLVSRSRNFRHQFKRRQRRFAEAGGTVELVPPERTAEAVAEFVRLHGLRAAAKAERHPSIDERCERLLVELESARAVALRVFEVRVEGRMCGVGVRLDTEGVAYSFNSGFDPEFAKLAPGMVLELASAEDAMERGLHTFDWGPGLYESKLRLGAEPVERWNLAASSSSAGARAQRVARALLGAARKARGRLRRLRPA